MSIALPMPSAAAITTSSDQSMLCRAWLTEQQPSAIIQPAAMNAAVNRSSQPSVETTIIATNRPSATQARSRRTGCEFSTPLTRKKWLEFRWRSRKSSSVSSSSVSPGSSTMSPILPCTRSPPRATATTAAL